MASNIDPVLRKSACPKIDVASVQHSDKRDLRSVPSEVLLGPKDELGGRDRHACSEVPRGGSGGCGCSPDISAARRPLDLWGQSLESSQRQFRSSLCVHGATVFPCLTVGSLN